MTKLTVHMPGQDTMLYDDVDADDDELHLEAMSTLVRYFHRPHHPYYDAILYEELDFYARRIRICHCKTYFLIENFKSIFFRETD